MTNAKDLMSEANEVKSNFISWGAVGDYFVGTLIGKRRVPDSYAKPGTDGMQTVYDFKMKEGQFHTIDDKRNPVEPAVIINAGDIFSVGGKTGIDSQMRNVKNTTIIGMKFKEEKEAKKKGNYPAKMIKVYTQGEVDEEYVKEMEAEANPIAADDDY